MIDNAAAEAFADVKSGMNRLHGINPDLLPDVLDELCAEFNHYPRDDREVPGSAFPRWAHTAVVDWVIPYLRGRQAGRQQGRDALNVAASTLEIDTGTSTWSKGEPADG